MTERYTLAAAKADITGLQEWQKRQNGTLTRIEQKVDKLLWRIIVGLSGVVVALGGTVVTIITTR